ncbi:MAG: YdcF family protein [Candidatus Obscuribacterales bacterium]|nr:YdcF family protein [Candidatus Obscuribacterales bacterium]
MSSPEESSQSKDSSTVAPFVRKRPSTVLFLLPIGFLLPLCFCTFVYWQVNKETSQIYSNVDSIPSRPAALVFGAGVGSSEARDRVLAAVALYKNAKVKKLVMTGDNGEIYYNEPIAMKRQALELGVPSSDVICDYAGFRTYDSLYRARDVFDLNSLILVSQRFHLPRALYIARNLGLNAIGFCADRSSYGNISRWYDLREFGAAQAAWLDLLSRRKPRYLGAKEPVFPSPN